MDEPRTLLWVFPEVEIWWGKKVEILGIEIEDGNILDQELVKLYVAMMEDA